MGQIRHEPSVLQAMAQGGVGDFEMETQAEAAAVGGRCLCGVLGLFRHSSGTLAEHFRDTSGSQPGVRLLLRGGCFPRALSVTLPRHFRDTSGKLRLPTQGAASTGILAGLVFKCGAKFGFRLPK